MRWAPLARRYAPLLAVALIQVLIVALAPSVPTQRGSTQEYATSEALTDGPVAAGNDISLQTKKQGRAVVPSAAAAEPVVGTHGATSVAARADRSHCRGGRQFQGITLAPPCVPKWSGRANGGATYRGVTARTIKIVRFDQQDDPTLQSLLREADLAATDAEEEAFMKAAERYINGRFELYGRRIELKTFKSACKTLPPVPKCFREEMARLVAKENPFFVIWNTPIASAGFDELSARKVLNAGGWQFSDRFHTERRPYHWDAFMSGTQAAGHVAEYWCKRLAGRTPRFAGPAAGKFDASRPRVLGVITADDPANQQVLRDFEAGVRGCGGGVRATYSFEQNPDRAAEQMNAGLDRMIEARVSTLVCLCDAATPTFIVGGADAKNYHPEHLVPGTGLMDFDAAGRLYNGSTQWKKGPARPSGAFGVGALPELEPYASNDATRVWRAAGKAGRPHNFAIFDWFYYDMVATMLQMAGPVLTPATVERGAFAAGYYGGGLTASGTAIPKVGFGRGDYTWFSDVREVVWSSSSASKLDGERGAYLALERGRRYVPGQWPAREPNPAAAPG